MLRLYSGPADQQAIIDLVKARAPEAVDRYPGVVDLQELLEIEPFRAHTCLWVEAGGVVRGFAILAIYEEFTSLIVEVGSQETEDREACLIDLSLERARQEKQTGKVSLEIDCQAGDLRRMSLLEKRGFTRQAWEVLHMHRSLLGPLPAPCLPEGFLLRTVEGEREVEALVDLHRAAWGTQNMTVAYRLAMMHAPTYEAELDLVVTGPGGRLAGTCTCFIDWEANQLTGRKDGYTDPVAVDPPFQRLGLAKALLLEGLHRLKARGMDTGRLSTSSANLAMQRAACAVGFTVASRTLKYEISI